ncbi:MAG: response regulator [Ignavibacteriales bacterium]|jgi:two-component system sensor histidine kinase/response regulator|nr:response regulator [Ignavibacteriales bacterium]MBP9123153.1 response regulator [Ignavibacteriaceae bacterium]MCC6636224.1 response regulator [Ignavibacteriaceae bacterium]
MTEHIIRILLVEDSPIAARLISLLLKEGMPEGEYQLFQNSNLTDAIRTTAEKDIHLVLLDLGLPESQGLDTFKTFFTQFPYIPVIVLTGNEDKSLALKAVREGAQDYLVKGEVHSSLLARSIFYAVERGRLQHEKMLNQEKLKKYSEELEVLNATKDKFFSILAHDLKSPFNAFIGITDILAEDIDILDKEQIKSFVLDINRSAHSQFKLLENLLAWAQMQRGLMKFEPIELEINTVINDVFQLYLDNAMEKDLKLINETPLGKTIKADHNMLYLLLRNLVYNAIKFTNPGGEIRVGENATSGFSEIYVADSGVGINPSSLSKMFRIESQSTTLGTAHEKGTGLGLVLCKDMVEKNGGTIRVSSEVGVGTTFYFTIPQGG